LHLSLAITTLLFSQQSSILMYPPLELFAPNFLILSELPCENPGFSRHSMKIYFWKALRLEISCQGLLTR